MNAEQNLAVRLRQIRQARGWSQTKLADWMRTEGVDLSRTVIREIESGRRPIRLNEALAAAAALGQPLEVLLKPVACATCNDAPHPGFTCLTCGATNSIESEGKS